MANATTKVTIRPGYMIRLSVPVQGGVYYRVDTVEAEKIGASGEAIAKWETTRIVADRAEHDAAINLRAQIRNSITRHCCRMGEFGLMATDANIEALREATAEARALADKWNATARTCRIKVALMEGRVRDTDVEAVAAIRSEIAGMLREIEAGIRAADPARIREACNKARDASRMLGSDSSEAIRDALESARKVAREMTKRVKEAGEGAADVLRAVKLDTLENARAIFLDTDEIREVEEIPGMPRLLDIEPAAKADKSGKDKTREIIGDEVSATMLTRIETLVDEIVPKRATDLDL